MADEILRREQDISIANVINSIMSAENEAETIEINANRRASSIIQRSEAESERIKRDVIKEVIALKEAADLEAKDKIEKQDVDIKNKMKSKLASISLDSLKTADKVIDFVYKKMLEV